LCGDRCWNPTGAGIWHWSTKNQDFSPKLAAHPQKIKHPISLQIGQAKKTPQTKTTTLKLKESPTKNHFILANTHSVLQR
jgi:hypothetical protein